ncbi:MAG: hypothetical protein COW71_07765 [Ignavibacteriales bacterium CG18_big_fil_WC_8_21_14_2_50_31_20]|nr:MAG: hypothetical protein COW71_07765 [Ignavibacteriales bacterium CG18_big_fil_WC_8_21_14_2_50_31_20]
MKTILLIGDSITHGFESPELLLEYEVKNVGVSGDSTLEALNRITNSWLAPNPEYIFISIGTNDLARDRSNSEILKNIDKIIAEITSTIDRGSIYLTSLFPTRNNEPRPNERIVVINSQLEKLCEKLGIGFFNLHPHFVDEYGKLKSEYTDDGLHLTELAYKKWTEILRKFLRDQ